MCAMLRGLEPRGLARQPADVGALDAKIVEFAGGKALQLADRVPVTPPAAVAGIEVADILRHSCCPVCARCVGAPATCGYADAYRGRGRHCALQQTHGW